MILLLIIILNLFWLIILKVGLFIGDFWIFSHLVLSILVNNLQSLVVIHLKILHMALALQDIRIGLYKAAICLGYTVECGLGENPLPISQFNTIYAENEGILVLGAILAE